jgi:lipopolysaccharide/colanic/teichoic acid biosynthesis glycosyltransferase
LSTNVVIASSGSKHPTGLHEGVKTTQKTSFAGKPEAAARLSLCLVEDRVSPWSRSGLKRLFDIGCVLLAFPLLIPVFVILGLAVRLTSKGPVLFRQKRTGMNRRTFTILKFRTMVHREDDARCKVTTSDNQCFTRVGPFLRRWKLDELPQVLNVLIGDMTLVGPRPKLPEHQLGELKCRPGITGAATIAFAREELILAQLPNHHLDGFYHSIILPTKLRLDREYMTRATFMSDMKLILETILRRWDSETICRALEIDSTEVHSNGPKGKTHMALASSLADITGDESLASGD